MSTPGTAEALAGSFARSWADVTVFAAAFDALGRSGVTVHQKRTEIARFCRLLAERRPRRILEVGTAEGGTAALMALAAAHDATIVTIDRNPCPTVVPVNALQRVVHVRGEAGDAATREQALAVLMQYDVLFLDGDHAEVDRDYALYGPYVLAGGIVAFHDICPDGVNTGRVPAFWRELAGREETRTCEIVDQPGQKGCGIGVLFF